MKKKVLIIGNSSKEYAFAKKMSETCEVYVASGNDGIKEFASCVDIRETSAQELLEFAMENCIDLTIPVSVGALNTDIVNLFSKNNLQIFAPNKEAYAKKIMYKLHIPTPKFGIFEKQAMANDYLKNINTPFVIKTNSPSSAVILTSVKASKPILDSIFAEKYNKIIIEDYIYGSPFAFYAITDGYKALPIGSSILYKHSLEGEGGQLTSGMGSCSPNYKISFENEAFIMNNIIYPVLDYLERGGNPYAGIISVNGILSESGEIQITGFGSFMQNSDCAGILELINTDIYNLLESCVIGSFSDEVDYIELKDIYTTSVVINCRNLNNTENIITGLDELDDNTIVSFSNNVTKNKYLEYEAKYGDIAVLTTIGRTASSSTDKVYNELKYIQFSGKKYRNDIGNSVPACI